MSLASDNFEVFEKSLLEFGGIQYDGLADDDDPLGHCLIVGKDGLNMMAIDSGMLAPENLKGLIVGVCTEIMKARAERIGWLLSAFEVDLSQGGGPPMANFADDPRRVEVFNAIAIEHDRVDEWKAPILRSPSRIGDWEKREPTGRNPYIQMPQKALAIVAENGDV